LNSITVASPADPSGDESPSSTSRTLVVDLLASAFFKLIAEGRALDVRDLGGRATEVIP
jgi:hypothetical protein